VDYSFVTNKKNKQTLFACVCVLVERRFRILQITKIYAEKNVFVIKRALERVRVRRDCDDVSNEKFGFFLISPHRNQKQKQPTPQKVKKVKKQASVADFEARSKKKRGEMKSRYRKTTIIKRIKTTENMLKKVDVSTRIAPVLSSF
tara:strand:- start:74 stop:511 length:438 start_codon:yes stop_codon:yes gene_type:complete